MDVWIRQWLGLYLPVIFLVLLVLSVLYVAQYFSNCTKGYLSFPDTSKGGHMPPLRTPLHIFPGCQELSLENIFFSYLTITMLINALLDGLPNILLYRFIVLGVLQYAHTPDDTSAQDSELVLLLTRRCRFLGTSFMFLSF